MYEEFSISYHAAAQGELLQFSPELYERFQENGKIDQWVFDPDTRVHLYFYGFVPRQVLWMGRITEEELQQYPSPKVEEIIKMVEERIQSCAMQDFMARRFLRGEG